MKQKSSHVIQAGPWAGKTVGEKRRIKRFELANVERPIAGPLSILPRAAIARAEATPGGIPQNQRPKRRRRILQSGLGDMSVLRDSLPTVLKPKMASQFFNQIPGLSKEGRLFLLAMTHPNNEELRTFDGIPDLMADEFNPYVGIDDSQVVTWDPTMFATAPPASVTTYGIYMLFPPFPEVECVYLLYYSTGTSIVYSRARVIRKPGFATPRGGNLTGSTIYQTYKDIGYDNYRRAGSGRTLIPICSTLNDQGNVVAGQLPEKVVWSDLAGNYSQQLGTQSYLSEGTITPTGDTQVFKVGVLEVPDVVSLTQIDKKCMDGQYRDGVYMPLVPSEPVDKLQKKESYFSGDGAKVLLKSTDGSVDGAQIVAFPNTGFYLILNGSLVDMMGNSAYHPPSTTTHAPNLLGIQAIHPSVSQPADMLTGFAIFSALSIQQASSNVSTAAIKIRLTDYDEMYPGSETSTVAVYRKEHPLHDRMALNLAADIAQVMPHALPACDNAFNGILGKIWNVIYKFVKPVVGAAKYLPLPYAGAVSGLATDAMDAVEAIGNASTI